MSSFETVVNSNLAETIAMFGMALWVLIIIETILLFLLPFFVVGIYYQTRKTAAHLKEIAGLIDSIAVNVKKNSRLLEDLEKRQRGTDSTSRKGR